jgi:diguanylate cyclase (GGDEF)-like protein
MISLRKALTIPFVILTLTLAATVAMLSYHTGRDAVDKLSESLVFDIAQRVSQAVDRHMIGSRIALAAVMSTDDGLDDNLLRTIASPGAFESRMSIATSLHTDPNHYVYYGNHKGQFLGVNRLDGDTIEVRVKTDARMPRQFFEVSPRAAARKNIPTKVDNFDPRKRPWYQHAAKVGRPSWTPIYVDFTKSELVATRVLPVYDADKKLEGVLATDVSLMQLSAFIASLKVSANGVAFLIDANGEMIASSTKDALWTGEGNNKSRVNASSSSNAIIRRTYAQFESMIKADKKIQTPIASRFEHNNGTVVSAIHIIEDDAGLVWYALIAAPRSDFMGDVEGAMWRSALVGVVASILAISLGLWILNWVTRDLRLLSQATQRIREGQPYSPLAIQRRDEIGDLARSFEQMHIDLQTDELTGLHNRETFTKILQQRINENDKKIAPEKFGVLFIDLDHFKTVNDEHGHLIGNQILIGVAARMRETLRARDFMCRYAGDEFAVLINGVEDDASGALIAEKLAQNLALPFIDITSKLGAPIQITASCGLARYPSDGRTELELLDVADKRMYRHKWLSR